MAAANHILRGPQDNPCIGLLICKTKDNVLAQYALKSSSLPIGISDLSNNRKRYIRVLVAKGLLAITILDKPNSKKQRYITIPRR